MSFSVATYKRLSLETQTQRHTSCMRRHSICDDKQLKHRECFTETNITKIARFVCRRNIAGVAVFFGPAAVWEGGGPSPPSPPMDPPLSKVSVK